MIQSGRGESAALRRTQLVFGLLFLGTRVFLYGVGVCLLLWHSATMLDGAGPLRATPRPLVLLVLGLIGGGYLLNLMWMSKIVRMATRPPRTKAH